MPRGKKPISDELRGKIIYWYSNSLLNYREIAEKVGTNKSTVGRVILEYKESTIKPEPKPKTEKKSRPPEPKKRANIEQIVDKVINYKSVVSYFELVGDKTMQVRMTKSSKPNREYRNIIGAIREMVLRELEGA